MCLFTTCSKVAVHNRMSNVACNFFHMALCVTVGGLILHSNFLYLLYIPFVYFSSSSDGMSRSGVFITCMSEIERVKVEGGVDIFQTVKAARAQRPHMVYTSVSYRRSAFCMCNL